MKRNRTTKGNYIKRWTAVFLALYMALSPMSPVSTVYADVGNQDASVAGAAQEDAQDVTVPAETVDVTVPEDATAPADAQDVPVPADAEDVTVPADVEDSGMAYSEPMDSEGGAALFSDSDTELPNEPVPIKPSESTGFIWKNGIGASEPGNSTMRFDFCGLQNGMTDYGTNGIQTTWNWQGYPTWLGKATSLNGAPPAVSGSTSSTQLYKYNGAYNGAAVNTGLGAQGKSELRIVVQPSSDNKYLYVDYYVYNGNNENATYYLGSGADAMINQDDYATCYQNPRGFHMVSTPASNEEIVKRANKVFDCITDDPQLGVSPAPNYRYVGRYSQYWNNIFTKPSVPNDSATGVDSGIAWGWKLDMRPYETVHRRVAFAIRSTSYYVSSAKGHDDNTADGTNSKPYATIGYAIGKIGANKGYIYLMDDVTDLGGGTITLNQGANQQITISSTDYDINNIPQVGKPGYIKELKANGTAFNVTGGATLTLTDLTLDGHNTARSAPMVTASDGSLVINSGTTIQNCNITAAGLGSAVEVTNTANLTLNRCIIEKNVSPNGGKGAIHFDGASFQVDGNVKVTDNTYPTATNDGVTIPAGKANVYLEDGKVITVTSALGSGADGADIGVTTARKPDTSPGGLTTSKTQEVDVAVPQADSVVDTAPCPFTQNFKADQVGSSIASGTAGLPNTTNNDKRAVRKIDGYTIKFVQREAVSQSEIQGHSIPDKDCAPGETVSINAPSIANYTLQSVTIDPATTDPNAGYIQVNADKTITGKMPPYNVTVYNDYVKQTAEIVFHSNGSEINPPTLSGNAGEPVNASFPYVSRPGYTFLGWSLTNAPTGTIETSIQTPFETGTLNYYAIYEPDEGQKFDYTVTHKNSGGTLQFAEHTTPQAYSVEHSLTEEPLDIHGYRWSSQSSTSPSEFNYAGIVGPIGEFNATGNPVGKFTGKMPAQALTINFRYEVDNGNPNARSPYTIQYQLKNPDGTLGRDVAEADVSQEYPETVINAAPKTIPGYTCVGGDITKGDKDHPDLQMTGPQTDIQGKLDPATHILTNSVVEGQPVLMPNRPVTIVYYYRPTAVTYGLTVKYLDKGSQDPALENILTPPVISYPAEQPVGDNYNYLTPYGYQVITPENMTDKSIAPAAALGGGIRWADESSSYTGTMPNQAATVTYRYNRNDDLWKELTYQVGAGADGIKHGSLAAGPGVADVSPDVKEKEGEPGVYITRVLISDGSDPGNAGAYRWSDIQNKKLVPQVIPDSGYRLAGWFMDPSATEPVNPTQTFQDNQTLTARFEPDPGAWCTIQLAVEHGSMSADAPTVITAPKGQNWGGAARELPLPESSTEPIEPGVVPEHGVLTADVNYLKGDWYQQIGQASVKMNSTALLENGKTYTYRFRPDPSIFGTTAQTPNAQADLNDKGEGRIKVYTYGQDVETTNYQYILTNQEGIVMAVQPGSQFGWMQFDHLYPGARYQIYEARTSDTIYVDHPIQDSFGDSDFLDQNILSAPAEVLTPVVETNYHVSYDVKEDGKTVLTIDPADLDSDYAVLNKDGTVVIEPGQESAGGWKRPSKSSGGTGTVQFSGLDYSEEYIVVARPKGMTEITAESKKEDGSTIITDLGSEPELKNCIVETLGGTVTQVISKKGEVMEGTPTPRYETAHEGDTVTVQAPPTEGDRNFLHWEMLIGPDEGIGGLKDFDKGAKTAHFTMPDTNIVLHAVYEKETASPSNASVSYEMRGGKKGQLALAPQCIPTLEEELTTGQDRILMAQNHAKVLYKVVYQKNSVKASESDAIKEMDDLWQENYPEGHKQAYKNIFGLQITAERYVDGRKVGTASPSDASIRTYVQTGKEDSDMLDYRLYRIDRNEDGEVVLHPVDLINTDGSEANPEETGGLFAFDGQIGERYALVCSQAYRLRFINDTTADDAFNVSIRVRKKENSADYMDSGSGIPPVMVHEWFDPMTGAFYHDPEWSYKNTGSKLDPFDFDRPITKGTIAYAWYYNDKEEVDKKRQELEQAIQHAIQTGNDHFLHPDEQEKVFGFVGQAQSWLDRRPMATKVELQAAIDNLKEQMIIPEQKLTERYGDYNHIQDSKPQGGSGGGGGGGGGSKKNPYGSGAPQNYQAPVNGNWEIIPGENGQPPKKRFNLNGGEPVKDMWARLDAPEGAEPGATGPGTAGPAQAGPADQGWYHFDAQGNMQTGWLCDQDGKWYYLNTDAEGDAGRMQTGFKQTPGDPVTYYLDPATGAMVTGWREIDGKWYYFNPTGGNVYYYDPTQGQWIYKTTEAAKPLGAMYKDETTPDGYRVGPDGVWIQ